MRIGFYTSQHYLQFKKEALEEAIKKLNIQAEISSDEAAHVPSSPMQLFGFEELFKRTTEFARLALEDQSVDVGIGIASGLSFIFAANEWFYVICIVLQTRAGATAASFTPGISVPLWMVHEVQNKNIKLDELTEKLAQEKDPVIYFSGKALTRKDLMVPALLLAFSKLGLEAKPEAAK